MRQIIGVLATFVLLTAAALTVLSLWGIAPFSLALLLKSGATMLVVCVTGLLLYLFYMMFFKPHESKNKL